MNKKVAGKINGKWKTFGTIKENKWGNLQLSMKNTQELRDFIANGGEWINLSLFDADEKKELPPETQTKLDELKSSIDSDEIPF